MRNPLLAVVLTLAALPANAQQLALSFHDGRVNLEASSVPVRTILTEWARLGGTKVVGADRVSGSPLTLTLVDMPEAQALDLILRNVAGYVAAPRRVAGGSSMYDRILVMATSSPPSTGSAAAPKAPSGPMTGAQRFVPPQRQDAEPDDADTGAAPPVFSFPQQPGDAPPPNIFQPMQGFGQPTPFGTPITPGVVNTNQAPQTITINPSPNQPPVIQFPGQPGVGGFGVIGAPTPGVIQQPTQPGQKPPGGN